MSQPSQRLIYKIVTEPQWEDARQSGVFTGAPVDINDGYIHFSTADQVRETAAKHFANCQNLLLIAVETAKLTASLKWEPSRGGKLFPHLYGDLNFESVAWEKPLPLANGRHLFPTEL